MQQKNKKHLKTFKIGELREEEQINKKNKNKTHKNRRKKLGRKMRRINK